MLSRETSIHLVFSMIFNQSCRSGTAFKASGELLIRLNRQSYELRELEYLGYDLLYEAIAAKPCLHRFPVTMAKYIYQSILILNEKYDSDPRNIWNSRTDNEIVRHLTALSGIGYHKAVQCLMYLNVLGDVNEISSEYINYMSMKCTGFFDNIDRDLQYIKIFV